MERDKEAVLDAYVRMTPEALDALTAEERHRLYTILHLRVVAQPDGTAQVSGAFSDDGMMCTLETTRR